MTNTEITKWLSSGALKINVLKDLEILQNITDNLNKVLI